jgi:hypothetical protein
MNTMVESRSAKPFPNSISESLISVPFAGRAVICEKQLEDQTLTSKSDPHTPFLKAASQEPTHRVQQFAAPQTVNIFACTWKG